MKLLKRDNTGWTFGPFGHHTIYGEGETDWTPFFSTYNIGRLYLHVFHRGDGDPDCHDHPWDFWTFPLTSYVEEFLLPSRFEGGFEVHRQVVAAFRLHFRPAEYTHRVLGRVQPGHSIQTHKSLHREEWGPVERPGKIVTIVWKSKSRRKWGFMKHWGDQWCWVPWKKYVYEDGKYNPCGEEYGEEIPVPYGKGPGNTVWEDHG